MGQSSQQTQSSSAPWAPQQPYLTQGFQDASTNLANETARGPYSGNYVAPTNGSQYDAATGQYNFSTGQPVASGVGSLLGSGTSALTSGTNTAQGAEGALSSVLQGNTASGLVGQANTLGSGYNVPAEVAAAMQPAEQAASESTLPNLYRHAAAEGNLNSDRTAVAQGVVDQGLGQTAESLDAQLQNQNFATSLGTAMAQNGQNISGLSALGGLGGSTAGLGAADITSGVNTGESAATGAQTGANTQQTLDQSNLNNGIDKYTNQQNFPLQALQTYMSMIQGNYGNQVNSTTTSTPSILSDITGGLGSLGSLFMPAKA